MTYALDGDADAAYLDQNGIKGSIKFSQHNSTHVRIIVKVSYQGLDNKVYKIYQHPSNYQSQCKDIGDLLFSLDEIIGHLGKEADLLVSNTKVPLHGPNSIQGHSMVVMDSSANPLACSTIVSTGNDNSYAVAAISNSKIAGKIEFVQQGYGDTMITGQISHSDSTTVATLNHKWYVLKTQYSNSQMVPNCPETFSSSDIYNPDSPTSNDCDVENPKDCQIGDLTGKHTNISVGVHGSKRFTVIDGNLPIHGKGDHIQNRLLVILKQESENQVLGCAIIKTRGPLRVVSKFTAGANKGIAGHLYFQQDSPYHQTKLQVDLTGLVERAKGYHVHQFPISETSADPCGDESVGGHLNPWKVVPKDSPPPNQGQLMFSRFCKMTPFIKTSL